MGRSWSDDAGFHRDMPNGDHVDLTAPNIGAASATSWQTEFKDHPNALPYMVMLNGQGQGWVWIPNDPNVQINAPAPINNPALPGGSGNDPRQVALDVLAHVPLPNIELRMNPTMGLVALQSWYWVDGYDGRPFGASRTVTIPPPTPDGKPTSFTVTVRIWGDRYDWDYGDGGTSSSHSLGKPYPQQSDITHTYQHSSLGLANGYPVRLTVTFAAEYSVNGGGAQALPSIRHTYENDFRVQELQPVLTGN